MERPPPALRPPVAKARSDTVRRLELGPWQLARERHACRLEADARVGGAELTLQGGGTGEPARIRLRLGETRTAAAPRFRPGRRYAMRPAGSGRVAPLTLAARSAHEAEASIPSTLEGSRLLTAIPATSALLVNGPGLAVTLALAPSATAAEAFVGCVETATRAPAPRPVAPTRMAGGWEVVQRADACSLHRLDGPIGVSVASLRGAGLVVTIHGRGAFEGGRGYALRFAGAEDGAGWTFRAGAVNADTLVWPVPQDASGSARVADLLRGGTVSVAGTEPALPPTRLPPAGAAAESFLRCGQAAFGTVASRPPTGAGAAATPAGAAPSTVGETAPRATSAMETGAEATTLAETP